MTNDHPDRSDEELVRLAQRHANTPAGSAAASELFQRYQERVYRWCHRRVGDHDLALDLAQDVQLNAYRALPSFESRAQFSSWLFAIARNRCMRALRRPSLVRDEGEEVDARPAETRDPASAYEQQEEEETLLKLMQEHLEPHERAALWLRCYHVMSVEDISRVLELRTVSGARSVLQSARRKLRAALGGRDDGGERP